MVAENANAACRHPTRVTSPLPALPAALRRPQALPSMQRYSQRDSTFLRLGSAAKPTTGDPKPRARRTLDMRQTDGAIRNDVPIQGEVVVVLSSACSDLLRTNGRVSTTVGPRRLDLMPNPGLVTCECARHDRSVWQEFRKHAFRGRHPMSAPTGAGRRGPVPLANNVRDDRRPIWRG